MSTSSKNKISLTDSRNLLHDIHEYSVNIKSREIYLHSWFESESDDEAGVDHRMANIFIKNLNLLNMIKSSNILIHQQSVGGIWNYGIAIYDALIASPSPTTMLAYAHSKSMSSITIQACDNRVLLPNTEFMVHYGSISIAGNNPEVYNSIDQYKKEDQRMFEIYASRCIDGPFFIKKKYDKKDIMKYLHHQMIKKVDWFLNPEEAIDYGFVDGILGEPGFETIDKIRKTKKQRKIVLND